MNFKVLIILTAFCFTFQVKQHLRLQQPQQLQPLSPEDSQTTALPGQSTTASKQHTTAHQTLNPWVQHHKPPRYIPIKKKKKKSFLHMKCTVRFCCCNSLPNRFNRVPVSGAASDTQHFFSPYTGLKLSPLFLLLTCDVCFMYFFAQGQ